MPVWEWSLEVVPPLGGLLGMCLLLWPVLLPRARTAADPANVHAFSSESRSRVS